MVERESHSVLCIVTLSRLLTSLQRGLAPLPPLLTRPISLLGVGAYKQQSSDRPRGYVSPRTGVSAVPPAALIDTPLGYALALMAEHRAPALALLDRDARPVDLLAAADVPALFRIATDIGAGGGGDASLLSLSCGEAVKRIETRGDDAALLTCRPSTSLAAVIQTLVEHRVHQLVVVDDNARYSGLVSAADVLAFLCGPM
eukprot:TRINITY_DN4554_c0_g1_i2.p3 TRINITY_DN4554_c0_g1~~TRINITY_DN4554_c0_g1_i2.p3  ORF type:complete len:201 (-),score=147.81 TRINITY_DN4554_c0_g1_i2:3-605(-)